MSSLHPAIRRGRVLALGTAASLALLVAGAAIPAPGTTLAGPAALAGELALGEAAAGTYDVAFRKLGFGRDGWTSRTTIVNPFGFVDAAEIDGALRTAFSHPGNTYWTGDQAVWRFTAPAGATISRVNVSHRARSLGGPGSFTGYHVSGDRSGTVFAAIGQWGADDIGTETFNRSMNGDRWVEFDLTCRPGGSCSPGRAPYAEWREGTITLTEQSNPSAGSPSGTLRTDEWQRGKRKLAVSGSDSGPAGVSHAVLHVGGVAKHTWRLDSRTRCQPNSGQYGWVEPCASSVGPVDTTVDTASLADGTHTATVRVYDAAGNFSQSEAFTIKVDNTPPPAPSGLKVTHRGGNEYRVTWANPSGGAPITRATVQECNSSGEDCGPSRNFNAEGVKVADVTAAQPGTRTFRVWLRDAAGNSSPDNAAVAGFAYDPPAVVTRPAISGSTAEGQVLVTTRGSWTNQVDGFTHRWLRCDTNGEACAPIADATEDSYELTHEDVGHRIVAEVTATNVYGSGTAASNPSATVVAAPPGNLTPPSIAGTARQGATLEGDAGTWSRSPTTFAFEWRRCTAAGTGCRTVDGAEEATYEAQGGDVGNTLRLRVTATNAAGSTVAESEPFGPIDGLRPTVADRPAISGLPRLGRTLSASAGTWTGAVELERRWQRCVSEQDCTDIPGATGETYVVSGDDLGKLLRHVVRATNAWGTEEAASQVTTRVGGEAPRNTVAPTITGTTAIGGILRAHRGTWNGDPTSFARQWLRCSSKGTDCVEVAGQVGETYMLTRTDAGHRLRVRVVAANEVGSAAETSAATAVVTGELPVNVEVPTITGVAREGHVLETTLGVWNGATEHAVQWERCDPGCTPIAGATGRNHTLGSADVGKTVRAVVTARNAFGARTAASAQSQQVIEASDVLRPPPEPQPLPLPVPPPGPAPAPAPAPAPPPAGSPPPAGPGCVPTGSFAGLCNPLGGQPTGTPNGTGASERATVSITSRRTVTVRYGAYARITGRLTDERGTAIANAEVNVLTRTEVRGARLRVEPSVKTGPDGRFVYVAAPGPSREIRFAYFAFSHSRDFRVSDVVRARVLAGISLSTRPRSLRNGSAVTFAGKVRGQLPRGGVLVQLQVRVGSRWQTFKVVPTRRGGKFTGRWRFTRTFSTTRYRFRSRVRGTSGFPYATGTSRVATVTVRP